MGVNIMCEDPFFVISNIMMAILENKKRCVYRNFATNFLKVVVHDS